MSNIFPDTLFFYLLDVFFNINLFILIGGFKFFYLFFSGKQQMVLYDTSWLLQLRVTLFSVQTS